MTSVSVAPAIVATSRREFVYGPTGVDSRQGELSRAEVDRQGVVPQEIQAEEPVDAGNRRQGVSDHREAMTVLTQCAEPCQRNYRHDFDRAPSRHLNLSQGLVGIEAEVEQGREIDQ